MRAFKRRRGMYAARLDTDERDVIAALVADVAELLGGGRLEARGPEAAVVGDGDPRMRIEPLPPPSDPAVRRLLPDASRDDPQIAEEFRRLTEDDLRAGKIARLTKFWDALTTPAEGWRADAFVVAPQDAQELAAAITDLRLVLAERLGIRTDEQAERLYDALLDSPQAEVADDAVEPAEILDPAARRYLVAVYGALSWLQESLVDLLLHDLRAPGRPAGP